MYNVFLLLNAIKQVYILFKYQLVRPLNVNYVYVSDPPPALLFFTS